MSEQEDRRRWREKTEFVPGVTFDDLSNVPETRYQVLGGVVYSLQVWADGSSARGTMTPDELTDQLGRSVTKEGWYDHAGKYLGEDPGLEVAPRG